MSDKKDLLGEPSERTKPYWDAVDEERLLLQVCEECNTWIYYPRDLCPGCFSTDLTWKEASGRGKIHTFTHVYYTPIEPYEDDAPYIVAIVDLEEGPRMLANIVNSDPEAVNFEDEVVVTFEVRGERKIPQFELAN